MIIVGGSNTALTVSHRSDCLADYEMRLRLTLRATVGFGAERRSTGREGSLREKRGTDLFWRFSDIFVADFVRSVQALSKPNPN